MKVALFVAGFFLLFSAAAIAQDGKVHDNPPQPKKNKTPKPKKVGPQVIIMSIIDKSGATGQKSMLRTECARAGVLADFNKKDIQSISPAEVQGTIDQLQIDFEKTSNWTAEDFDKLANPWQALYVAGVTVDSVAILPHTAGKDSKVGATADITIWLYDTKQQKFLAQQQPFHWVYSVKKGDMPVDNENLYYEVLSDATQNAFRPLLDAKKNTK